MLPPWLKPSYIAIAVLVLLLGVQTWRLTATQSDVAEQKLVMAQTREEIATKRTEGVQEGRRQQLAAQAAIDAQNDKIIEGLRADNLVIQKHYDNTYNMLKDFAAKPEWECLSKPLPESVLQEFRR